MTPKEARNFITRCQKKYPNVKRLSKRVKAISKDDYCVGGALIRFCPAKSKAIGVNIAYGFPGHYSVMTLLRYLNPELAFGDEAFTYAAHVLVDNDQGKFAAAWKDIERALCYPKESLKDTNATKTTNSC
jgi:hypothetical protein